MIDGDINVQNVIVIVIVIVIDLMVDGDINVENVPLYQGPTVWNPVSCHIVTPDIVLLQRI